MNDEGRKTKDEGSTSSDRHPFVVRRSSFVIVDYGVGNLRNVYKALEAAGAPAGS